MRIVFMGTPDFAVPALKALHEAGHEIVGVFTQPDKPVGRKQILTPPPVKTAAREMGLAVYQEPTLKTDRARDLIADLRPDVIVVAAYGKILPKAVLDIPPLGCINIHGSLLPKYRGAAPIQRAVMAGEKETGVTAMLMNEGLDTGDILETAVLPVGENETAGEVFDRMAETGARLIVSTLDKRQKGLLVPVPQDDAAATWAPPLQKSENKIDWTRPARAVHDFVRGLNPWPVAETTLAGREVRVFSTRVTENGAEPGEIVTSKQGFAVACGDGVLLEILELQPKGGKRMSAAAFLCGLHEGLKRIDG